MKTTLTVLTAIVFALTCVIGASAQTKVHFAVGAKYWLASWNTTYVDPITGNTEELDPATGSMIGLTGSLKVEKFGLNVTFFSGSGWEWTEEIGDFTGYDELGNYYEYYGSMSNKEELSRSDLILTVSYNIIPQLSLNAGYKSTAYTDKFSSSYDYDYDVYDPYGIYQGTYTTAGDNSEEYDINGSGPGGGIGLNLPITKGKLSFYANLGYFSLGDDLETGDTIIDAGLNYILGSNWVISGGYRYEAYEEEIHINGVNIGISYFK